MSIRNLDALFDPDSIAVIGASTRIGSIGNAVWQRLTSGTYAGKLYAVNPKYRELGAHPVVPRTADLPCTPALAVICTPPSTVPRLIADLAAHGTRAAVVMTTGMTSVQKQAMRKAARSNLLRLLGPDSLGLLAPHQGIHASSSPIDALPGELAFVSESAGLMTAMLDWANESGIGFSHCVSLGEQADVDFGDMLDYLARDPKTRAILRYAESILSPRKFMTAARAAARNKPVVIVKAGRSPDTGLATTGNSGVLTDSDMVFDAAISRAGMLRVNTLQELLLAAETLSRFRSNTDESITVLTNGRGAGVIAADAAFHAGVNLSVLDAATRQQVDAALPANGSHGNPLIIPDDASVTQYELALRLLQQAPASGALLFIHTPNIAVSSAEIARILAPLARREAGVPPRLLACWLGGPSAASARETCHDEGIATFDTPEQAINAFSMLTRYRHSQAELTEAPPALPDGHRPDMQTIRMIVQTTLAKGRTTLDEPQSRALLEAFGIAASPAQHSDTKADANAQRRHTQELMVGSRIDSVFGPVILFGRGGRTEEATIDRAVALPPLNVPLAKALVSRTRISRWLTGSGNAPPVNEASLHALLVAVSQLLSEVPEIARLEINPLAVSLEGSLALNVHIELNAAAPGGANNFAIRPYPAHLEETVQWQGRTLLLRPIRPEDEALHMEFLQNLAPQDIRMRVFYSRRSMERSELARLVQIDYAREMVFIAVGTAADGRPQTLGVVRAMTDPDNVAAEFGVIVRSDLKGAGLGRLLMRKLIDYLRTQGTARLEATVLDQNDRMLKLARGLGFEEGPAARNGEDTRDIVLKLT